MLPSSFRILEIADSGQIGEIDLLEQALFGRAFVEG